MIFSDLSRMFNGSSNGSFFFYTIGLSRNTKLVLSFRLLTPVNSLLHLMKIDIELRTTLK
jgi:hypothetical protein